MQLLPHGTPVLHLTAPVLGAADFPDFIAAMGVAAIVAMPGLAAVVGQGMNLPLASLQRAVAAFAGAALAAAGQAPNLPVFGSLQDLASAVEANASAATAAIIMKRMARGLPCNPLQH